MTTVWAPEAGAQFSPALLERIAGDPQGSGGDVGEFASLATDAEGGQHIAYYDASFQRLRYAHRISPTAPWVIETLVTTSTLRQGRHCSLAVGAALTAPGACDVAAGSRTVSMHPGVTLSRLLVGATFRVSPTPAYRVESVNPETRELTLATPYTGSTGTEVGCTLRFYQPAISFQEGISSRRLRVAHASGDGGWAYDIVDDPATQGGVSFTGFNSSVGIGPDGSLHVAYRDGATTGGLIDRLRYAFRQGQAAWKLESPDPAASHGFESRLVVDQRNGPIIFHRDNVTPEMLVTFKDSGTTTTWQQRLLETVGDTGRGISATYYAADDRAIGAFHYQATPNGFNRVSVSTGGRIPNTRFFNRTFVLEGTNVALYTSLAHGPTTATLAMAYYDGGDRRLKALNLGSGAAPLPNATPRILDMAQDTGLYCSAAVDPISDDLYVAHYDARSRALKLAQDDGATTDGTYVDGVKWGTHSAIGLTGTHVVVAYHATTEGTLRLARWPRTDDGPESSAAFVDEVIDDTSFDVGESVSMAIDANDTIYLVYFDRARRALRGAAIFPDWTSCTGRITGAAEGVDVGEYCDLAINKVGNDPPDRLGIAFYILRDTRISQAEPTLYYGECRTLATTPTTTYPLNWTFGPALIVGNNVGRHCSIAYGAGNTIHLAYFNDGTLSPNYATVDEFGNRSGAEAIEGSLFEVGGMETSIAVNTSSGNIGVAYYDITNAGLKYAERIGDAWDVTLIDADGDTGHDPVLRFDQVFHRARILYYNRTAGRLRLATKNLVTGEWEVRTLLGDTIGYRPALAIEPTDGSMAMSFHQISSGNLLSIFSNFIPFINSANGAWKDAR
jgi:hypothetical protein